MGLKIVRHKTSIWHGTSAELNAVRSAADRYCQCVPQHATCSAHNLLLDQRSLDRLLFVRRTVEYWVEREHRSSAAG